MRNGVRSNKKLRNVLSIDASGAYCKDRIIGISKMKIEVVEKHRISLSFRISRLNSDLKKLYEAYSLGTIEKEDYLEERELNRKSLSIYERGGIYFTNIQDEVTNIIESEGEFTIEDFKDYKKKVNRYINENQNHISIYKLKNNERLTASDFKELEKILWSEVGTKEEYEREYGDKSLSILVREIVGLDQKAANEAFSEFLNNKNLNSKQIRFLKHIVDYVVKNGVMKAKELTEEPFRNIGSIIEVFDTETALKIVNTIEEINENATNIIGA